MPRTIRTKVYKFRELVSQARIKAVGDYIKRMGGDINNPMSFSRAYDVMLKSTYEFTKEGNRF